MRSRTNTWWWMAPAALACGGPSTTGAAMAASESTSDAGAPAVNIAPTPLATPAAPSEPKASAALASSVAPATTTPPATFTPSVKDGMAYIPAGDIDIGTDDGVRDTRPRHKVTLAAFEIDVTELTVAAYRACVRAGSPNLVVLLAPQMKTLRMPPQRCPRTPTWRSPRLRGNGPHHRSPPVTQVVYDDAR